MLVINKYKYLYKVLILIISSIMFSCADEGGEENTHNEEENTQNIKTNITPKNESDDFFNKLKNKYSISDNRLTRFDSNTIKNLKEDLKNKDKKTQIKVIKKILERNELINKIIDFKNNSTDESNKKGMIILNQSEDSIKTATQKNIADIIGKHDQKDINDLEQTNKKLKSIIDYNNTIQKLINEKTQKNFLNIKTKTTARQFDQKDILNDFPNTVYQSTEEFIDEISKLSKLHNKTKLEILKLIKENADIIKKIKQNKFFKAYYFYDQKDNKLKQIKYNTDIFLALIKSKKNINKNVLQYINTLCKEIIKSNESNLQTEYFLTTFFEFNKQKLPYDINDKKLLNSSLTNYEDYIETLIKEKIFNILNINTTTNQTFFNQSIPDGIDLTKYEKTIKYTIKMIEKMYYVRKPYVQNNYYNKSDKSNNILDIFSKEKLITTLINFVGGETDQLNISHRISEKLNNQNYKKIASIIEYLHSKGLDLKKNKYNNNGKINGTSFIEQAQNKGFSVTIKGNKVEIKPTV